jgi:hypothetical protein
MIESPVANDIDGVEEPWNTSPTVLKQSLGWVDEAKQCHYLWLSFFPGPKAGDIPPEHSEAAYHIGPNGQEPR